MIISIIRYERVLLIIACINVVLWFALGLVLLLFYHC